VPRTPRRSRPGTVVHLISRFVDRNWYIGAEAERTRYLELLQRALRESDWRCLGYGVMSNHIHNAAIVGTQPLASWIRRVHSPFADWMNRTHDRIGAIFVRGPKEIETPPERVGALIAYIHNNPVRAGIVPEPSESDWTSHRAYLGHVRAPDWLHVRDGLAMAGIGSPDAFDPWVRTRPGEDDVLKAIEQADEPPLQDAAPCPVGAEELVRLAADELGIAVARLCSRRRTLAELVGRRVAVHAAARVGMCGAHIASALGLSQQAASRIGREPVDRAIDGLVSRVLGRAFAFAGASYPHNA
jgi:hypothetical protein